MPRATPSPLSANTLAEYGAPMSNADQDVIIRELLAVADRQTDLIEGLVGVVAGLATRVLLLEDSK